MKGCWSCIATVKKILSDSKKNDDMKQSRLPDGKRQLKGGIFHGGGSSPLQLCTLMQIYTNSGPTQGQIWQVAGSSREIGFPDVEGHCLHSVSHASVLKQLSFSPPWSGVAAG